MAKRRKKKDKKAPAPAPAATREQAIRVLRSEVPEPTMTLPSADIRAYLLPVAWRADELIKLFYQL